MARLPTPRYRDFVPRILPVPTQVQQQGDVALPRVEYYEDHCAKGVRIQGFGATFFDNLEINADCYPIRPPVNNIDENEPEDIVRGNGSKIGFYLWFEALDQNYQAASSPGGTAATYQRFNAMSVTGLKFIKDNERTEATFIRNYFNEPVYAQVVIDVSIRIFRVTNGAWRFHYSRDYQLEGSRNDYEIGGTKVGVSIREKGGGTSVQAHYTCKDYIAVADDRINIGKRKIFIKRVFFNGYTAYTDYNPGQEFTTLGYGYFGDFISLSDFQRMNKDRITIGQYSDNDNSSFTVKKRQFLYTEEDINFAHPPRIKPPKRRKPDMSCCVDFETTRMLRLILKRIGSFPATVPNDLTSQNPTMIGIPSVGAYQAYMVKQLDALLGAFPIEIEIEDTDLTKDGNQSVKLSFKNVAQILADIYGVVISDRMMTEVAMQAALKAMVEAGSARKAATIACDIGLANADFLDYEIKHKKDKIPLTFTPNEEEVDKILQPYELEIETYECADKKGLKDYFRPLLELAAMWKGQNFIKAGKDLKDLIFGKAEKFVQVGRDDKAQQFDQYLEDIEQGFTNIPGYKPTSNTGEDGVDVRPYDRPYNERPKIREFGAETMEEDDEAGDDLVGN